MAKNEIFKNGWLMSAVVSHPATPVSGQTVRLGILTGVASTNEDAITGKTSVDFGPTVYDLAVKGVDDSGDAAIAIGDPLFRVDADAFLSKKASGYFFGVAWETVDAGETDTVWVGHIPSPGAGSLSAGSVGLAALADHIITGETVATVANVNTVGGIPVVYRILVPSGANGDVDVVLASKTRVIDAWAVLKGAGTAGSTLRVKSTATAITDLMDVAAGGDRDVFRCGEIDDAAHEIAAAGTLRVSKASTGGDFPGAEVYVEGLLVA